MPTNKSKIGITMGDPASIGPEITLKALANPAIYERCQPVVIGDASVMEKMRQHLNIQNVRINAIDNVNEGDYQAGVVNVLDMKLIDAAQLKMGQVSKEAGNAAFQYVKKVIELAMNKEIDATVTNAFNKEAINLAGHHYAGHTEIYAELTNSPKYTMMLAHDDLRVVHVSTHVSLREACDRATKERVLEVIRIADEACKNLGIANPKIGVAGLNPHSGEGGLFGREEIDEIIPAIEQAQSEGILAEGPVPPDTLFPKARGGWYDIVVAMYHDQGHIPLKVIGFVFNRDTQKWDSVEGINITLGLPIIRASVDHGTAFDQAGKGTASELSLLNALDYAIKMADTKLVTV